MKLDITTSHNTTIITILQDRMDASVAPDFRATVIETLHSPHAEVVVDMQQVSFIDSSVLGAMVASYKLVISNNGSFALCGVGGAVLELLELTRLDSVFPCYPSVTEAQNYLRAA